MYLSKTIGKLLATITFTSCTYIEADISLTDLKGLSTIINPAYRYVSPALGTLCYSYAQNLAALGSQTSEAVIFLHQLFDTQHDMYNTGCTIHATSIGRYLDHTDIGVFIGLAILAKKKIINERTMVTKIEAILKKVMNRKHYEIKKAITDQLQKSIEQDTIKYKEVETRLISMFKKKDRKDLKKALLALSCSETKDTENIVVNCLKTYQQKKVFASLQDLHKNLKKNRTLLDHEQRASTIISPLLKDSMGAFSYALAASLAEEGTIYLTNNTINLLLAFLWHKATHINQILEALKATAETISLSPDQLFKWHPQEPYTIHDYAKLKEKTESEIETLPLEDLVFARYGSIYQDRSTEGGYDILPAYAANYFQSLLHMVQKTKGPNQKATLNFLIASFAPDWRNTYTMDPKINYCRFLMQPTRTVAQRIALVVDIGQGKINMTGMECYYVDAISNIYHSLPQDFESKRLFFDTVADIGIRNSSSSECIKNLKNNLLQWILQAHDDQTKAAILDVILTKHLLDIQKIEGFEQFDLLRYCIYTAKTIQSDMLRAKLIILIMTMGKDNNEQEQQYLDTLSQWAVATIGKIVDEDAQIAIIKQMMQGYLLDESTYLWARLVLADLHDDNKKADLIIDLLSGCCSQSYPINKYTRGILSTLIDKTLPSISLQSAILKVIRSLLETFPCSIESYQELYRKSYDWLKEKLPTIQDEKEKVNIINLILDVITKQAVKESAMHDQDSINTISIAIERGLQSIHGLQHKMNMMTSILSRPVEPSCKALYFVMYHWIERNLPDIKDQSKQQEIIIQLETHKKKYQFE